MAHAIAPASRFAIWIVLMKKLSVVVCSFLLALPVLAQQTLSQEAMKHWKTSKDFTLAVAEIMPPDSFEFKPNPEEMGFGLLFIHLSTSQANTFARVTGGKSPLTAPDPTNKQAVIKYITDSFDFCIKTLEGITPEALDKMVGKPGAQTSVREGLWAAFTHTAHHRGQAEVYLRVKNLKPPLYKF
jgi:uncharacterized damage-inducible protein DinB